MRQPANLCGSGLRQGRQGSTLLNYLEQNKYIIYFVYFFARAIGRVNPCLPCLIGTGSGFSLASWVASGGLILASGLPPWQV
jgi:hypothetical protein